MASWEDYRCLKGLCHEINIFLMIVLASMKSLTDSKIYTESRIRISIWLLNLVFVDFLQCSLFTPHWMEEKSAKIKTLNGRVYGFRSNLIFSNRWLPVCHNSVRFAARICRIGRGFQRSKLQLYFCQNQAAKKRKTTGAWTENTDLTLKTFKKICMSWHNPFKYVLICFKGLSGKTKMHRLYWS